MTNHKSQISTKAQGFTLVEMLVVISIMVLITTISLIQFRNGEKRRRVHLAADTVTNAIRQTQSLSQSGKKLNNPNVNCQTPSYYEIRFTYAATFNVYGQDNCNNLILIETHRLPAQTQIASSGLVLNGAPAASSMYIKFTPPFAKVTGELNGAGGANFTTATIRVETTDGSVSRTVTVDGVSGRIGE